MEVAAGALVAEPSRDVERSRRRGVARLLRVHGKGSGTAPPVGLVADLVGKGRMQRGRRREEPWREVASSVLRREERRSCPERSPARHVVTLAWPIDWAHAVREVVVGKDVRRVGHLVGRRLVLRLQVRVDVAVCELAVVRGRRRGPKGRYPGNVDGRKVLRLQWRIR